MNVAKVRPQPVGSLNRIEAIVGLMMAGADGEFVIVHQDGCPVMRDKPCNCVPSIWRVVRGKT